MPKQKQTCRNRIQPAALRHEHGQRNTFPRDWSVGYICRCALIVQELKCFEKLEAGYPAVK